jgi:anaerobic magnesium-protoporphyrin IX monomethyl ester cyclase
VNIWGFKDNLDLLLVNSPLVDYSKPHPEYTVFQPPIGLAAIASYLDRRGYRVGVWDSDTDQIAPQKIADGIGELKPRWVGFNTFTSGLEVLGETLGWVKEKAPYVKIMLGGVHATIAGRDFLELQQYRDVIVVRNDGEFKCEALIEGVNLQDIPGIEYLHKGSVVMNSEDRHWLVEDIDSRLFALNRRYVPYDPTLGSLSPDGKRRAFVASSRGCPYECTFCSSSRLARENMPVRFRSTENVVEEIKAIVASGVLDIKFNDELAWFSERRIKAILGELVNSGLGRDVGLQIRGNGRANIIASCKDSTLDLMAVAGVRRVGFGVEQGTKEGMKRLKKHISPEEVIVATTRLAERGIPVLANFMFNIPGEDETEMRATVALAKELVIIGRRFNLPVELDGYPYRAYQGTELYEHLIEQGYKKQDLARVIQLEGKTGGGSHLQVEPFIHLSDADLETEEKHRAVLDNLTNLSLSELHELDREYPIELCLGGITSSHRERE